MLNTKRNLPLSAIKRLTRRATIATCGYLSCIYGGKGIGLKCGPRTTAKTKMMLPMSHNHYQGKKVWILIIPAQKIRRNNSPTNERAPGSKRIGPRAPKLPPIIPDWDDTHISGDLGF